jgi:alanyl-tRNA synthetase
MEFSFLKDLGFKRFTCSCGINFWSRFETNLCGECDPKDSEKYKNLHNPVKISKFDLEKYCKYFSKLGYQIDYTYTTRSSLTNMNFINAGIVKYKPLFTSDKPNSLNKGTNLKRISNQVCFRFKDHKLVGDNTHLTSFMMLGQHKFWVDQEKEFQIYFYQVYEFLLGLIPNPKLLKLHESIWTDSQSFGKSLEFFSNNTELGNQVFTTKTKNKDLKNKFLDLGLGYERIWCYLNHQPLLKYFQVKTKQELILKDHLRTILIAKLSGIYPSKLGPGYNVKVLENKIKNKINKNDVLQILDQIYKFKSFRIENNLEKIINVN